jgi:hypothetical protein
MKKAIFLFVCILTISSGFSQKRERIDQANKMTQEQRTTSDCLKTISKKKPILFYTH